MLKIGVQSACWYSENDPEGSFKMLHDCGFQAVDFNIDHKLSTHALAKAETLQPTFFDQSIEELLEYYRPLKEAAEHNGIVFSQMHAPFPLWIKGREDINDYVIGAMEKICAICAYVGCPAVVVHPITRSTKAKEHETNLTMYRRMIPGAKKYGIKLCLENLFGGYKGHCIEGACAEVSEACWYIDTLNAEAGEEVFGFCLDVGHANLLGRNLREYINTLGHRLTILHIHDNNGREDLHGMPYTQTHNWGKDLWLDWDGFIEGLRDINYQGVLNFETFRVLQNFPRPVWPEALKLLSAVGRYFAARIEAPKEEPEV